MIVDNLADQRELIDDLEKVDDLLGELQKRGSSSTSGTCANGEVEEEKQWRKLNPCKTTIKQESVKSGSVLFLHSWYFKDLDFLGIRVFQIKEK